MSSAMVSTPRGCSAKPPPIMSAISPLQARRTTFRFRSAMIPLDGTMLIESNFGSYSNERTPRHIARGGMDHYMVTLCFNGAITFGAGVRSVMMRPGDLCLQDMTQASRTQLAADRRPRSRPRRARVPASRAHTGLSRPRKRPAEAERGSRKR